MTQPAKTTSIFSFIFNLARTLSLGNIIVKIISKKNSYPALHFYIVETSRTAIIWVCFTILSTHWVVICCADMTILVPDSLITEHWMLATTQSWWSIVTPRPLSITGRQLFRSIFGTRTSYWTRIWWRRLFIAGKWQIEEDEKQKIFHVDTDWHTEQIWSNLIYSGLYVNMNKKLCLLITNSLLWKQEAN